MRILITGGAGFIASHIADAYIAEGHQVVVVDNLSSGRRENLNSKAKFYHMDICDKNIADVFEKERPEVLNHHAAQIDVRKSVADPASDCRVNVIGLLNVMECARKTNVKKVIFASSGGAMYGEQQEFPATESHPEWPLSPYGIAKLVSEKYLYYYQQQYGIPYVALRYANIYGPRQNAEGEAGVVSIFINKMLSGETPIINGDGKQTRDYVYVGDVVKANVIALKEKAKGAYNIGTGVETDVNQIFMAIREFTNFNVKEIHGEAKAGEQLRSVISSIKIAKEFGWKPDVKLFDGLRETVDSFRCGVRSQL